MLARVGADGYMVGVYRYVGWDMDASKNALVGDLRRSTEVADVWSDADRTAHLFVPLNKAASELHLNHGIFFIAPILGRSPFADVPTSIIEFDDDQKNALQRVKFEELTP